MESGEIHVGQEGVMERDEIRETTKETRKEIKTGKLIVIKEIKRNDIIKISPIENT